MDFYLFEMRSDGRSVHFPVNPEEFQVQADGVSQTYNVLTLGEISIPRGRRPSRYSWSGFLPGIGRRGHPALRADIWRLPKDIIADLEAWQGSDARLRLMVTETEINVDVYVESFKHTRGKGSAYGDVEYDLQLVEYRPLTIRTDGEGEVLMQAMATDVLARPAPPIPGSYTVQEGDTLWSIAKRVWDDGSRWQEIYQANADLIGPDPNAITAGMELQIPGGEGGSWPPSSPTIDSGMGNVHLYGDTGSGVGMGDVQRYGN